MSLTTLFVGQTINYFNGLKPGKTFYESFDGADVRAINVAAGTVDLGVRGADESVPQREELGVRFVEGQPEDTEVAPFASELMPRMPAPPPPPPPVKRR